MNSTTGSLMAAMITIAALTTVPRMSAQEAKRHQHPRYVVRDVGTFGGQNSFYFSEPVVASVNNRGIVVGGADTPAMDPFTPSCASPDCHVLHAFAWLRGDLKDLGTLPGGTNSTALWVNERGLVMGASENGVIDPVFGAPQQFAMVWKDGQIISLGSLGGGINFGNAMNNLGEVVGIAANAISDPFSFIGVGTEIHAFLWRDGVMVDLGTLGGPDSWAASINEAGQVAGWALVDSTVNATTGQPTQHPFLWERGRMTDLQTLGGTFAVVGSLQSAGAGASLNNRGQVIGTSNLTGDLTHHPFLWDHGVLTDLGTLGGDNGEAWWINNAGEIVGRADFATGNTNHHAFLWKNGNMIDLGVAPGQPCSTAIDINSRGQIIINTGICGVGGGPGALWEQGSLYVLNDLIPANSGLSVGDVNFINDRGEIAVTGHLPNGDQRAVVLVPCDHDHPGLEGCDFDPAAATNASAIPGAQITQLPLTTANENGSSRAQITNRFRSVTASPSRRFVALHQQ